jgi:hypothetical protein
VIVDLLVVGHVVDVAALGNGNDAVAGRGRRRGPSQIGGHLASLRVPRISQRWRITPSAVSLATPPFTLLSTNL